MLNYSEIPMERHITFTLIPNEFIVRPIIAAHITGISDELGNALQLDPCGEKRPPIQLVGYSRTNIFWAGVRAHVGARQFTESSEDTAFLCPHT